jgi:integrase
MDRRAEKGRRMTETSTDVHVWKIKPRKNPKGRVTSYGIRWRVATEEHYESRKTRAHAESFRAELVSAASRGEAFLVAKPGLPVSMVKSSSDMTWFDFACAYVDMKWPELAGNSRKGVSETLTTVTPAMFQHDRGKPDEATWRSALHRWAFNRAHRQDPNMPDEIASALKWLSNNTSPVSALSEPSKVRELLQLIATRQDGKPSAASVVRRKRAVLHNILDYAVEQKLLVKNPLADVKWTGPKLVRAIDKRTVVNHQQATKLLDAVRGQEPSGPRLVALFGAMYYAGLRPAEAVNLRRQDVVLPPLTYNKTTDSWEEPQDDWGELLLSETAPETGARWSETGKRRGRRQLKHRGKGDTRPVPCPPQLTKLFREHIRRFPPRSDGLLFRGVYTDHVSGSHYAESWRKAREAALSVDEVASPLAKRPYDLRHAAVSTWLNSGVPPTQVAEWAGHSVAVLLQIYAKCITGQEQAAKRRIEETLRGDA